MKEKGTLNKNERAITLIALVVTIVVLLILSGITITMLLGEDGIIAQAKLAAEKTKEAEEQQEKDLQDLAGMINEAVNGKDPGTLQDAVSSGKVFSNTTGFDSEGNKVDGSNEEKKAIITIPAGFSVKEGSIGELDKGVVIADQEGNEFVWVPCADGEYKAHTYTGDHSNDNEKIITDTEGGWNTLHYKAYSDWIDDGTNETSVKKYGGFYIARYEAGIPSSMTEVYVKPDGSSPKTYTDEKQRNTSNYVPVSKKGAQAWNYISQENAKKAAERMYRGNTYVTSQLVDGIAWDTIVEWIAEDPSLSDIVKKDSTEHGNYGNTSASYTKPNNGEKYKNLTISSDVLYAQQLEKWKNNAHNGWNLAKIYKYGQPISGIVSNYTGDFKDNRDEKVTNEEGLTYRQHLELSTGASEDTKLKNIYDLGGNMYEWTTETGYHKTEANSEAGNTQFAVLRGGSFYNYGSSSPVSYRIGDYDVSLTDPGIGFRVILYVKNT